MATAHLSVNLLDDLKTEAALAEVEEGVEIVLTPYLTLACGLLYMVASDGDLGSVESSHLQSVLGGDEVVLQYALRYVQTVPLQQFFSDAPEVLSTKDKWCILANVCDALLSDGRADREELDLFAQMLRAFGIEEEQFEPYFKILALKNDKQVLGRFTGVKDERQPMTPHFALAIALLYMLTADGSIGRQEIGQLEAVIGEFADLQNVALKYVRSVKLKQFLDEASALMTPDQKLYILVNVCDSMMSDGAVARLEDKVFVSMLAAFGYSEKAFDIYLRVLETKCFKPFDTHKFVNGVAHHRLTGGAKEEGVLFDNDQSRRGEGVAISAGAAAFAANQAVWSGPVDESAMGAFINRTMADNIQSVSDSFENQDHVTQVAENATDALNLQKVDGAASNANNRQTVTSEVADPNRQRVGAGTGNDNLQQIDAGAASDNRQLLAQDNNTQNLQSIDSEAGITNRVQIDAQAQLKNIHEVVEEVQGRLDKFERDHFRFLQIGRAQRYDDAFALVEDDASADNWQMIDASFARMGLRGVVAASVVTNRQTFPTSAVPAVEAYFSKLTVTDDLPNPRAALPPDSPQGLANVQFVAELPVGAQTPVSPWGKQRSQGAMLTWKHAARVSYVKLLLGCVAVAFASPIDIQKPVRRAVSGHLVMLPASPELLVQRFPNQQLVQTGLAAPLD
jgi:uncharacterized tellurite resistance protein B-like protein